MAILHSLWQSALLVLFYLVAKKSFLEKGSPLGKRNFLFALLLSQVMLFGFSFAVYYSGFVASTTAFAQAFSGWLQNDSLQMLAPWLFLAYMLVILYKLASTVYGWTQFRQRFRSGLQKAPVELKLFAGIKAHQFGIKRKVTIWLSNTIHTPVTFGFIKPVILLPVALVNNISTRQAETLVIHELIHIRTNDYLLNWFLLMAETAFFFNPFVLYCCQSIRLEREKNCDMGVMAFEYPPVLYAETLLQAEKIKQQVPAFQLAAVTRKKQLLERIRYFSGDLPFNQNNKLRSTIPAMSILLLMFIGSALLVRRVHTGIPAFEGSAAAAYIPASSIEIPAVINNDATTAITPIVARNKNEKPLLQNKYTVTASKTVPVQADVAITVANRPARSTYLVPVAVNENHGSKQIIIQEESSGASKTSTLKTYALRFVNGEWILEPVWTFSAKELSEDSLLKKMDSSAEPGRSRKLYPAQQ